MDYTALAAPEVERMHEFRVPVDDHVALRVTINRIIVHRATPTILCYDQMRASTAGCGLGRSRCRSSLARGRSLGVPTKSTTGSRVVRVVMGCPRRYSRSWHARTPSRKGTRSPVTPSRCAHSLRSERIAVHLQSERHFAFLGNLHRTVRSVRHLFSDLRIQRLHGCA